MEFHHVDYRRGITGWDYSAGITGVSHRAQPLLLLTKFKGSDPVPTSCLQGLECVSVLEVPLRRHPQIWNSHWALGETKTCPSLDSFHQRGLWGFRAWVPPQALPSRRTWMRSLGRESSPCMAASDSVHKLSLPLAGHSGTHLYSQLLGRLR